MNRKLLLMFLLAGSVVPVASADDAAGLWTSTEQDTVDAAARAELAATNVPAISVAIVRGGRLVYAQAYGKADLSRQQSATPATRFAIGSVSKQFTAAAILLLVDQGKLSLDDPVAKFFPNLRRAREVTVRELLSHTSGYPDYFEQEFIPAEKQLPTTATKILARWATDIPLDFEPGTKWQYSGTNYVILGQIIEQLSGLPFYSFLERDVLRPAGINDAVLADGVTSVNGNDAEGYLRYALGPPHPAPRIGANWLYAMAGLSMTAEDLAKWDISIIGESLLSRASYEAMETEIQTTDHQPTGYSLGFFIGKLTGADGKQHTLLRHPGEVSGFRAQNYIVPEAKTALVVLTNAEYSDAGGDLAKRLEGVLGLAPLVPVTASTPPEQRVAAILAGLAQGKVDGRQLTADAAAVFTPEALAEIRESLLGLGALKSVKLTSTSLRGGMTHYAFTVTYAMRALQVAEYDLPSGLIEQFMLDQVSPE